MERRTLLRGLAAGAVAVPAGAALATGTAEAAPPNYRIAFTDLARNRIVALDRNSAWNEANVRWKFTPGTADGWADVMECKVRNTDRYGMIALFTAGNHRAGRVGIGNVSPSRLDMRRQHLLWEWPLASYPHSIERIEHRNGVVAVGTEGTVHVFGPTGADIRTLRPTQNPFVFDPSDPNTPNNRGPHGILWDPQMQLLWMVGGSRIHAYRVSGENRGFRVNPTPVKRLNIAGNGHDLQPDYTDKNLLLLTDTHHCYTLDKRTMSLSSKAVEGWKSYSRHSSGEFMWTRADNRGPRTWAGTDIRFSGGVTKSFRGTEIYKARIWDTRYQRP